MKKKKLLSLKTVMDSEIKGITWENVHVLGKNNIRQLVKDLREGLHTPRKLTNEVLQSYKKFPQGTAEYKERKLLEVAMACATTHRKEVIAELVSISRELPNMPLLPQFQKELAFGEALYTYNWLRGIWMDDFYFNLYPSRHLHRKHISLADLSLLQQQKKNKPFLALWKKQEHKGYNLNGLLAILLPTEEEMLEKRVAVATANMQSPEFSEVKDNLVALIENDKERLDVLKKR